MHLLVRKFIRFLRSLIDRLPSRSASLRPLLWLWYTLLRLTGKRRKESSQGPTARLQDEQSEKPSSEKAHKLPLPYDTQRIPRISVISCSSVPSMSSTRPSEDSGISSPQTPNFPFPMAPPPVVTNLRNTHRQQTSLSTVSSALSPTETVYGDTSFDRSSLYDSPSHDKQRKYSMQGTRRKSQSSFSSLVPNTAVPNGTVCAPPPKETFCIHPSATDRWDRKIKRSKDNKIQTLPRMTFKFAHDDLPDNWVPHVHPEGQLYFYRDVGPRRYITDAHLYDHDIFDEITRFLDQMEVDISRESEPLPESFEIVLELRSDWGDAWGYYMVDHSSRCVFWMDELDVLWAIGEEFSGLTTLAHFKHWIDVSYWRHWELFPAEKIVPLDVMRELTGILLHGSVDLMTSLDSNMPWTNDQTDSLLGLVKKMEYIRDTDAAHHVTAAAGRLMWFMANEKFLNFHGQSGARIGRDQEVDGDVKGKRTFLITILSPFLFSAPDTHLRQLEKLWVDNKVTAKHWKQHVQTLKDEWIEFILYATVLLNANVAFLAIPLLTPNQDNNSDSPPISSPSQIASLLSIISSMGSIILGLILVRQHRTKAKESSEEAAAHLSKHKNPRFGFEPLAVMSSLPYAFLMWGMVTFLAAMAFLCFDAVNSLPQRVITAGAWVLVLLPIAWIVVSNWEPGGRTPYSFFWNIRRTNLDQSIEGEDDDTSSIELGGVLRKRWESKTEKLRKMWRRRGPSSRKYTNSSSQVHLPDSS